MNHPLSQAAHELGQGKPTSGIARMASACGVTYQAAKKWVDTGCLPRTEWTGETAHAEKIAALLATSNSAITRADLMTRAHQEAAAPVRALACATQSVRLTADRRDANRRALVRRAEPVAAPQPDQLRLALDAGADKEAA